MPLTQEIMDNVIQQVSNARFSPSQTDNVQTIGMVLGIGMLDKSDAQDKQVKQGLAGYAKEMLKELKDNEPGPQVDLVKSILTAVQDDMQYMARNSSNNAGNFMRNQEQAQEIAPPQRNIQSTLASLNETLNSFDKPRQAEPKNKNPDPQPMAMEMPQPQMNTPRPQEPEAPEMKAQDPIQNVAPKMPAPQQEEPKPVAKNSDDAMMRDILNSNDQFTQFLVKLMQTLMGTKVDDVDVKSDKSNDNINLNSVNSTVTVSNSDSNTKTYNMPQDADQIPQEVREVLDKVNELMMKITELEFQNPPLSAEQKTEKIQDLVNQSGFSQFTIERDGQKQSFERAPMQPQMQAAQVEMPQQPQMQTPTPTPTPTAMTPEPPEPKAPRTRESIVDSIDEAKQDLKETQQQMIETQMELRAALKEQASLGTSDLNRGMELINKIDDLESKMREQQDLASKQMDTLERREDRLERFDAKSAKNMDENVESVVEKEVKQGSELQGVEKLNSVQSELETKSEAEFKKGDEPTQVASQTPDLKVVAKEEAAEQKKEQRLEQQQEQQNQNNNTPSPNR